MSTPLKLFIELLSSDVSTCLLLFDCLLCPAWVSFHSLSAWLRDPGNLAMRLISFVSLTLHNAQSQNRLICFSHKTWRCYAHSLPNVRQVSICRGHNSEGCNLSFAEESYGDI